MIFWIIFGLFLTFSRQISVGIGLNGENNKLTPLGLIVDDSGNIIYAGKNEGSVDNIPNNSSNFFVGMMNSDGETMFFDYRNISLSNGVDLKIQTSCHNGSEYYFWGLITVESSGDYIVDNLSFNQTSAVLFKYDENGYVLTKLYIGNIKFTDCLVVEDELILVGDTGLDFYQEIDGNYPGNNGVFISGISSIGEHNWSDFLKISEGDLSYPRVVQINSTSLIITFFRDYAHARSIIFHLNEQSELYYDYDKLNRFTASQMTIAGSDENEYIYFLENYNNDLYYLKFKIFPREEPFVHKLTLDGTVNDFKCILLDSYMFSTVSLVDSSFARNEIFALNVENASLDWSKKIGENNNELLDAPLIATQNGSNIATIMFSYYTNYDDEEISEKYFLEIVQFKVDDGSTDYENKNGFDCYFDEDKFLFSQNTNYDYSRRGIEEVGRILDTCICNNYLSEDESTCVENCGDISQYTPSSGNCTTNCTPYYMDQSDYSCKENCIKYVDITNSYCVDSCTFYPNGANEGENTQCTEDCVVIDQYFPESGNECQINCINYNNGTHCFSSCPEFGLIIPENGKICVEDGNCPHYQNESNCVSSCTYVDTDNYTCVDNCDSHYYPESGNVCQNTCSIYNNGTHCFSNCSKIDLINPENEGEECVEDESCPHYQDGSNCVSLCTYYVDNNNYTCVTDCDPNFFPENGNVCQTSCSKYNNETHCISDCSEINLINPENEGEACVEDETCPHYQDGSNCESSCTYYVDTNNYTCVDNCDSHYYPESGNVCQNSCSKYNNETHCFSNCSKIDLVNPENEGELCVENNACPHYQDGSNCVSTCTYYVDNNNYTCVDNCDTNFIPENGNICQNSCSKYNNGTHCISNCSDIGLVNPENEGETCLEKCPKYQDGEICTSSCTYFVDTDNYTCVSDCGSHFYPSGALEGYNEVCTYSCPSINQLFPEEGSYCVISEDCPNYEEGDNCTALCTYYVGVGNYSCVLDCDTELYPYGAQPNQNYICTTNCTENGEFFPQTGKYCENSCTYLLNGTTCVDSCPKYVGIDNYTCVDSCESNFIDVSGKKCVDSCGYDFINIDRDTCVESCGDDFINLEGTACVESCGSFYKNGKNCTDLCPFYVDYTNTTCVDNCTGYYYPNGAEAHQNYICTADCFGELSQYFPDVNENECQINCTFLLNGTTCRSVCPKFVSTDSYNCTDECEFYPNGAQEGNGDVCTSSCLDIDQYFPESGVICEKVCPNYLDVNDQNCVNNCDSYFIPSDVVVGVNASCVENCSNVYQLKPESGNLCLGSCPNYLSEDGKECVSSCSNYIKENGKQCVDNCDDSYYPYNASVGKNINCVSSCDQNTGEYIPEDGNSCVKECPNYIDENEVKCVKTCPNYISEDGKNCLESCPELSDGVNCVQTCPTGKFANSEKECKNCISNCSVCTNSENCQVCKDSYSLSIVEGVMGCVTECPVQQFSNESHICVDCPENCFSCSSLTKCDSCTYHWRGDICDSCPSNFDEECTYCDAGYILDEDDYDCEEKEDNSSSSTTIITSVVLLSIFLGGLIIVIVLVSLACFLERSAKKRLDSYKTTTVDDDVEMNDTPVGITENDVKIEIVDNVIEKNKMDPKIEKVPEKSKPKKAPVIRMESEKKVLFKKQKKKEKKIEKKDEIKKDEKKEVEPQAGIVIWKKADKKVVKKKKKGDKKKKKKDKIQTTSFF